MNPERDFDFIKDWIKDALLLEPKVLEVKQDGFMEATHTRIRMKADPDLLESCAFGYIYGLSVLSFADARPRGVSGMHFSEQDEWTPEDMLRHLRFEKGALHFYADYVRGRCLKTTIEAHADGTVILDAVNRGEAASRWVAQLQGRKALRPVKHKRAKTSARKKAKATTRAPREAGGRRPVLKLLQGEQPDS